MNKLAIALAAVALTMPAAAIAQQPVRVHRVLVVEGTPDRVWAEIGAFGAFERWYPPAAATALDGTGRQRTVTLKNGGEIVERLTATGERRYTYELVRGRLPASSYRATIVAHPSVSPDRTIVEWYAEAVPQGVEPAELEGRVAGILQTGFEGIAARFTPVATQQPHGAPRQ